MKPARKTKGAQLRDLKTIPLQERGNCSKVNRRAKGKKTNWLNVCCGVMIFVLLGVLTFHYIGISEMNRKIAQQELELENLKKDRLSLSGTVAGIKSSSEIAEEAKFRLGMVYPEDDQIVYIDVDHEQEDSRVNDNVFLSPVISVLKLFRGD